MEQLEATGCGQAMDVYREPLLIKSKQRVQKHGEVFTPRWVVEKMIAIPGIKEKTEDVFATFLEPSAGEGAFLLAIENAKLQHACRNYSKESWGAYALWALTSIYGIEFLEDNLNVVRRGMLDLFAAFCETVYGRPISEETDLFKSARTIILANIVQGDALTKKNRWGEEITFSCWSQVPGTERMVERTAFTYSSLLAESRDKAPCPQGSLFGVLEQQSGEAAPAYAMADIEQVWREERENG